MRSKVLVIGLMMCVALFSLGCGGGGGDSGSGGTTTTNPTLSGSLDKPVATVDGWAASIRPAFDFAKLTATAYGAAGTVLGTAVLNAAGTFTITLSVTADTEVTIKITSPKGFEMSLLVGKVTTTQSSLTVSATSTCQLLLQKQYSLATDTSSAAFTTLYNAFIVYLAGSPALTTGKTIVDELKSSTTGTTLSAFTTAQSTIKSNFTAIETALKAKDITTTVKYFSTSFADTKDTSVTLDNFKSVTSDRFTRYTIDSYTFNVEKILFTDATTATVYGSASIAVTGITDGAKQTATVSSLKVIWRVENGSWVVYKDFPYLKSQLGY